MLPLLIAAAAACGPWHGQVSGYYTGEALSSGRLEPVETWIEPTPKGLAGRYVLHEPTRKVDGTLEALGDEDCTTALFRWTDVYGTGLLRLRFHPARRCFEGFWGDVVLNPSLTYTSCARAPVTS